MAFQRLRGFGTVLGGFGRKIIEGVQRVGGNIADVLGLGRAAGVEVETGAAIFEWGQVSTAGERQGQFANLAPGAEVPQDWYEESTIPWDKPVAYKVAIYGRDLATGRFSRQEMDITVSRPLTVEQALNEAQVRVGIEGQSPSYEIFSLALVGVSKREGEAWRW